MTKLTFPSHRARNTFPQPVDVRQQALDRLYERKATLEALIESLEAYARCRVTAPVVRMPARSARSADRSLTVAAL